MKIGRIKRVLGELHRDERLDDLHGASDGRLLKAFVALRAEAAFEALARRHGPMVFAVCRRVLGNGHDAEDAYQATFLVLARKAASVTRPEQLGNWLYGVAYRTSLQARATRARRRAREVTVDQLPERAAPAEASADDLRQVLDSALSRLPDKYRVPVVLCELEGRGRREVAKSLGIPEGTLSFRLATARKLLARRLARYGAAPAAGVLATGLAGTAGADISPSLRGSTVKAAVEIAAGRAAAVSAEVTALMEGVLQAMFVSRFKTLVVVVMALGLFAGAGWIALGSVDLNPPNPGGPKAQPAPVQPGAPRAAGQAGDRPAPRPQGKVEPPGAPLAAVLKVNKDTYKLDLSGLTAEQFRKVATASNDFNVGGPFPPAVDLVLEVRNTSDKDIQFFTLPDLAEIILDLKGPDALTVEHKGLVPLNRLLPNAVTLGPGKVFTRPIGSLSHGQRDNMLRSYWLAPGEYTLTARFHTSMLPAPAGAEVNDGRLEPQLKGFGVVTVTTSPLTLKVIR
jgi:RNA polymerase sigma factor (sigma-70 family)